MNKPAIHRQLADFLQDYPGFRELVGSVEGVDYTALSIDSRTTAAGDLFLALRGEHHDGHAYVADALKRGAAAAVMEKSYYRQHPEAFPPGAANLVLVENTLDFLQQLAAWRRSHFDVPLIAVTGSNGKTTTREMIGAVLAVKYRVLLSEGNKNNHIGLPLTLLRLGQEVQAAVVELGTNHPGEIAHLTRLARPTAAVITNIGKGHLGYFGTLESVFEEKTALFREIPGRFPRFINMEDAYLAGYQSGRQSVIRVGLDPRWDVWGRIESEDERGRATFRLNDEVSIKLPLPGRHQVMNALLAAAVGRYAGIEWKAIRSALETFVPAAQRMELLDKDGVLFVNDAYNANPDSMRAALEYLARLSGNIHRRIAVLGDMLELGEFAEKEHRALGRFIAEQEIDEVYLYGPMSQEILNGILSAKTGMNARRYSSHRELARDLRKVLAPGVAVLLKGSRGMAMERVLEVLDKGE